MGKELPITDYRFNISRADIEQLWEHGIPTDNSLALLPSDGYVRAKRSENGEWHVKQFPLVSHEDGDLPSRGLNPEQLCVLNDYEHHRLKLLGLHVISFARVPLNDKKNIMTVAPWVEGIKDISTKDYFAQVHPVLKVYYKEWVEEHADGNSIRPFYIVDSDQFSTAPETNIFFLHDTDPAVGNSLDVLEFMDEVEKSIRKDGLLD
jgi:hypothetical protein